MFHVGVLVKFEVHFFELRISDNTMSESIIIQLWVVWARASISGDFTVILASWKLCSISSCVVFKISSFSEDYDARDVISVTKWAFKIRILKWIPSMAR